MRGSKGRILSVTGLLISMLLLWAGAYAAPELNAVRAQQQEEKERQEKERAASAYDEADKELTFWYCEADCASYAEACVRDYYEETGVAVEAVYVEPERYLEQIYDASMAGEACPDVYLTWNDAGEKAYLYGVSTGEEYPVFFNTLVLAYRTGSFPEAPGSIQEILDFGQDNEVGEGVGNLLEWNVADGFYNYAFVGDSISLHEDGTYSVEDTGKYNQELTFFQSLSESVGIDTDTINRETVLENFNQGATLTAIVDSDDLDQITAEGYGISALPSLNGELAMRGCARTGILLVNEFSEGQRKELARDFASFVAEQETGKVSELTPHISVDQSVLKDPKELVAYEQYSRSVPVPDSVHGGAFWARFTADMTGIWNGGALPE